MSKNAPKKPTAGPSAAGRLIGLLLAAAVVVTLAVLITLAVKGQNPSAAPHASAEPSPMVSMGIPSPAARKGAQPGIHFPSQGNPGHDKKDPSEVAGFVYNSDPPTSGMHLEQFNDLLEEKAPLPKYQQVHLLEHGNVLIQYNCTCPDIVAQLKDIAEAYDFRLLPSKATLPTADDVHAIEEAGTGVILAPYPSMKHKIAVTAWMRMLPLEQVDRAQIMTFINAYLHQPPPAN
jgi:hypothetical protein